MVFLVARLIRIHLQCGRSGFNPWVRRIPRRREWLPTPVFWPGEYHGLYSPWGRKELDTTERLSLHLMSPLELFPAATAAARSLQSCPTLCDPIDSSPLGSSILGILQARTLEWVAISFSNAWKWKVKVKSLSCARLLATPWTAAYQASPSMGFSRQEYWSGVPLPSLRIIPYPPLNKWQESGHYSLSRMGMEYNFYFIFEEIRYFLENPSFFSIDYTVFSTDYIFFLNTSATEFVDFSTHIRQFSIFLQTPTECLTF